MTTATATKSSTITPEVIGGSEWQVLLNRSVSDQVADRYTNPNFTKFVHDNERAFCRLVGGKCAEDGQIAALICASEGLTATQFVRKYHLIMGKPSMKAVAMLAEWRLRGNDHEVLEQTANRAAIALIRKDGKRHEFELTWQQAEASRFPWVDWRDHSKGLKDNWATDIDKRDMLWSRCISNAVSTLAPEITSGIYTPEEMQDIHGEQEQTQPAKATVTAADLVAQAAAREADREQQPETTTEVVTSDGEISEGCTHEQRERIRQLYQDCEITHEQQEAALAKRGVNSLNSLSSDQAAEIIEKLEEYKKKRPSLPTGQSQTTGTAT